MSFARIFRILIAIFLASQIYWFVRARALVKSVARTRRARIWLTGRSGGISRAVRSQLRRIWTAREPHPLDLV
jgi:hypothetical protein